MLVEGSGLLVSLPAEELRGIKLPASLFPPAELDRYPISNELRWAMQAATLACAAKRARMLVVARPEIFTHGQSLTWLQDQLMGVKDHLCMSDGTAVRPIPGMRNHLFLYRRASQAHSAAFERLIGWLPELLDSVQSQVNSCITVRSGRRTIAPPTLLLQANAPLTTDAQLFALRHHSDIKISVRRTSQAQPQKLSPKVSQVTYVPLTDSACRSANFMKRVASTVRASQRPGGACVLMRLPASNLEQPLESCMQVAVAALRTAGINKPVRSGSVLFATDDPGPTLFAASGRAVDLFADSSYEFWRHPQKYFTDFRSVELWSEGGSRQQQAWRDLLSAASGRSIAPTSMVDKVRRSR
jgi:hypothetical protein